MHLPEVSTIRLPAMREHLASGCTACGKCEGFCGEWVHTLLAQLRYEHLSRDDKGLVRQYIQHTTGYSRAQTERFIAAYRRELEETVKIESVVSGEHAQLPAHEHADAAANVQMHVRQNVVSLPPVPGAAQAMLTPETIQALHAIITADHAAHRRRTAVFALAFMALAIAAFLGFAGGESVRADVRERQQITDIPRTLSSLDLPSDGR